MTISTVEKNAGIVKEARRPEAIPKKGTEPSQISKNNSNIGRWAHSFVPLVADPVEASPRQIPQTLSSSSSRLDAPSQSHQPDWSPCLPPLSGLSASPVEKRQQVRFMLPSLLSLPHIVRPPPSLVTSSVASRPVPRVHLPVPIGSSPSDQPPYKKSISENGEALARQSQKRKQTEENLPDLLDQHNKEKEELHNKYKEEISALNTRIYTLENTITMMRINEMPVKMRAEQEVAEMAEKLTAAREMVNQLEEEVKKAQERISHNREKLIEDNKQLKKRYEEVFEEKEGMKRHLLQRIRQAKKMEDELNQKIDRLEEEIGGINTERDELRSKVEHVEKQLAGKVEELNKSLAAVVQLTLNFHEKVQEVEKLKRNSQSREMIKSQLEEQKARMTTVLNKMAAAKEQAIEALKTARDRIKTLEEEIAMAERKMREELERKDDEIRRKDVEQERLRANATEMVNTGQKELEDELKRHQEEMAEKMKKFEEFKDIAVKSQGELIEKNKALAHRNNSLAMSNNLLAEIVVIKKQELDKIKGQVDLGRRELRQVQENASRELEEKEKKIVELENQLAAANEVVEKKEEEVNQKLTSLHQKLYAEMENNARHLDEKLRLFEENEKLKQEARQMKMEQEARQEIYAECQRDMEELQMNLTKRNRNSRRSKRENFSDL